VCEMAVTVWLLSLFACSAMKSTSLSSVLAPDVDTAAKFADKMINKGFRCKTMDSCGDCFYSGCFWQPSAKEGERCQEACMITASACYGSFAPYEIPPPNNIIHCPGGANLAHSILRGNIAEAISAKIAAKHPDSTAEATKIAAQHAADIHHAASSMLKAHIGHAAHAAGQAGMSAAASRAHAAALLKGTSSKVTVPSVHDAHGCSKAKGTSWCASKNTCIAHFEENCPHGAECSAHLSCDECTKHNCFFSPGAKGLAKCSPMCLIENGNCYGLFSPVMIPPPHNRVSCPAHASGPDAKCRSAITCEDCFANKCFWTPKAHTGYKCNSKCSIVGAACFGTFDPHFIAFPHNVVQCPSMLKAHKNVAAKKTFNCTGDNTKWPKNQRAWCCTYKKKGCMNTVNCKDQSRMMNWAGPVRRYCCATYHTACSPILEETKVYPWPATGLSRSKNGWYIVKSGGYLQSDKDDLQAFVKFTPVLAAADYKVELAYPSSPTFSRATIIQVEAMTGRQVGVMDQSAPFYKDRTTSVQWHEIGIYSMDLSSTVVLSATSNAKGPVVVAGIRFTPVKVDHMTNPHVPSKAQNTIPSALVHHTTLHHTHPESVPHSAAAVAAATKKNAAKEAKVAEVAATPKPITTVAKKVMVCPPDTPVSFEMYESKTEPDFGTTTPSRVGCVGGFSLASVAGAQIKANTEYTVRFFATVKAPHDGDYLFNLTSAGEANLFVDMDMVVSDKMKAMTMGDKSSPSTTVSLSPKYGKIHLKAGLHRLELQYFGVNHPGSPYLNAFYTGPGLKIESLMKFVCDPAKCSPRPKHEVEMKAPSAEYYKKMRLATERKKQAEALVKRIYGKQNVQGSTKTGITDMVKAAEAAKRLSDIKYPHH